MKTKHRINIQHEPKHFWNGGIVPHARWLVAPLFFPRVENKDKTREWIQLELFPAEKDRSSDS
jgi:hypothetical protein